MLSIKLNIISEEKIFPNNLKDNDIGFIMNEIVSIVKLKNIIYLL
ncbi:hypothetical protein Cru_0040 [Candidatus Carsonella ruddii DC]